MLLTLVGHHEQCQLAIQDDSEIVRSHHLGILRDWEARFISLDLELQSLDLIDLLILEVTFESDGMRASSIGRNVHLSSKAALERARKLVKRKLLISQTLSMRGGIQPANLFFPAPELKLKAIQEAIAKFNQEHSGKRRNMEYQPTHSSDSDHTLASLDPINLLILSLIGRGELCTAKEIQAALGLTPSPVRRRLRELTEAEYILREEGNPFPHRPGIKEYRYSLTPSIPLEHIQGALSQIDRAEVPSVISWEVFLSNSGLASSHSMNGKTPLILTKHNEVKASSSAPQKEGEETVKIWKILRAMAEKIAEYEDRIAKLEAKAQSQVANEDPDAILALIPPKNS